MNNRTSDLLLDLAWLLKKYGPEEFVRLSGALRDPANVDTVCTVLEALAVQRNPPKAAAKAAKPENRSTKDAVIDVLMRRIEEQRILLTIEEIKGFAERLKLPKITSTSRPSALTEMRQNLSGLNSAKLKLALRLLEEIPPQSDLAGWVDIILGQEPSTNTKKSRKHLRSGSAPRQGEH